MPKGINNTDNASDEHFIFMKSKIESNKQEMKYNRQDYDDKMMKVTESLAAMLTPAIL